MGGARREPLSLRKLQNTMIDFNRHSFKKKSVSTIWKSTVEKQLLGY